MRIEVRKSALKEARKVPTEILAKLFTAVGQFAENRSAPVDVKALKGTRNGYRIRSGDYRILFTVEGETLTIESIGPRGGIYD